MPSPRSQALNVRSVRTPEAISALRAHLDSRFPLAVREAGQIAFEQEAVLRVWSEADHHFKGEVQDQQNRYLVTWFYTRGEWSSRCSCAAGTGCLHAYASGLAWIASVEAGARDGRDPAAVAALVLASAARSYAPESASRPPMAPSAPTNEALERDLASWLRALPSAEEAVARATPALARGIAEFSGLRVRLSAEGGWFIEIRPALDKPWKNPPQKWLYDLTDLRPADFEHLPPAEAALGAALAAEARIVSPALSARRPLPEAAVHGLLRTRAARPALCLPDGSPLVVEPSALVLEAIALSDEASELKVQLVTSDGRLVSSPVLAARRPEALYLFDGRLWRGPPPIPSNRLPAAALRDPRLLPRLRAAGLRLPSGLASEVITTPLRSRLKCWLSASLGSSERDFQARLTAHAATPACEQIWTGTNGWQWAKNASPPTPLAGAPMVEFDLTSAREVATQLSAFRLTWDGWAEAWFRPVIQSFPDEFLLWHATLPTGLDVELSPELAALLGAPLEARVDVSIHASPDSDQDWFDLTVGLKVADTTLSAEEVALLLKARGKWVHLPRHGWRRVSSGIALDASSAAALNRLGLGVTDALDGGRPVRHRLHVVQLALEAEALAASDGVLIHALQGRAAKLRAAPPAPLPSGLSATLRPYQIEGFQFLAHLTAQGFGGVLADDMGLGKTVQTLAWILHLAEQPREPDARPFRVLVVCPKSVTHGWLVETARFAPELSISAFPSAEAPARAADDGSGLPDDSSLAARPRIVVANYTQLRLNASRFRAEMWDAVVLDEGQFIKNPRSQVALAARSLRARRRLVLTGTPIENRLLDLWSIYAFAQPGLLGDQAGFRRQYPETDPAALTRLHRRVRHFLLRRTKAQAAPDLPSRTEDEIVVELEGEQRRLYDAELKRARAQLLGVETASALDAVRFHVLASLLRLRQICCHPALIDPEHAHMPSAKLDALFERIEELADEGHQVLVFSQFVEMLELIRSRLKGAGIGHLILTGKTENRAELVESFQSDPSKTVFLLSLKAAGFGLNLTAASYAFLFDPWWNPAAEAQAIDRIHRIGQTKPVTAYRLIAEGTVEEKIRLLQREKAALADAVIQEESLAAVMDLDSLRKILA
ncbi:MAG: DEAD/DEAH box helicase [Verrucomicrobia bacterium]|nr:MAG: DEAD/DEAH box helicase [Verrucomicrobiota bacterium]